MYLGFTIYILGSYMLFFTFSLVRVAILSVTILIMSYMISSKITMYSNIFVHSFLEWIGSFSWPDQSLVTRATSVSGIYISLVSYK